MSDSIQQLAGTELFEGLSYGQLQELLYIARIEIFERDAIVFRDGDPGGELFVVLDGRVRISLRLSGAKDETLGLFCSGESFGEMTALGDAPEAKRSATATAQERSSVVVIEGAALRKLVEDKRDLGFVVMRNLVGKLSRALRCSNDKVSLLAESARF